MQMKGIKLEQSWAVRRGMSWNILFKLYHIISTYPPLTISNAIFQYTLTMLLILLLKNWRKPM